MKNLIGCIIAFIVIIQIAGSGCANIIPPGGGPRDSIPPKLMAAIPKDSATRVKTKFITLTFDEFVDVKDVQQNLVVSPNPQNPPLVDYKLRNVTIKLKDSLEPNTTYSLNFGNAVKDVNEGNILKNFTYVFSTGNTIDKNSFKGKVMLAETGKTDSTLIVILYRNLNDTAVIKNQPRYYTKVDAKGNFIFNYLPQGFFAAYVLPNEYSKQYGDSTKMFAFLDSPVVVNATTRNVVFYAFEEAKKKKAVDKKGVPMIGLPPKIAKAKDDNRLRFIASLENGRQDILNKELQLQFNRKLKRFDSSKILLCNTNYTTLKNYSLTLDSTQTKLGILYNWKEDTELRLVLTKDAVTDTLGYILPKADTIKFTTKKESEYGSLRIRFTNLDVNKNPVLQLVQDDVIVESIPLTEKGIFRKLYKPGDYELRILFDKNKNGIWDTGNFKLKKQPEIVQQLDKKITVKNNWDNEYEIKL